MLSPPTCIRRASPGHGLRRSSDGPSSLLQAHPGVKGAATESLGAVIPAPTSGGGKERLRLASAGSGSGAHESLDPALASFSRMT